jgi:hypothetical protein
MLFATSRGRIAGAGHLEEENDKKIRATLMRTDGRWYGILWGRDESGDLMIP